MAVDGRLKFIEKEMYDMSIIWLARRLVLADSPHSKRVEKQISDIQEQSENKKMEVSFSLSCMIGGAWFLEPDTWDMLVGVVDGGGDGFMRLTGKSDRYINYRRAYSSSNNHK